MGFPMVKPHWKDPSMFTASRVTDKASDLQDLLKKADATSPVSEEQPRRALPRGSAWVRAGPRGGAEGSEESIEGWWFWEVRGLESSKVDRCW